MRGRLAILTGRDIQNENRLGDQLIEENVE